VNLISRRDETAVWPAHILHSISLLFELEIPKAARIADIGSGGGFPGIPLAILLPGAKFVLIESIRKKCIALEDMIHRLGLTNARVMNARAEDASCLKEFGRSFDLVLARAVGPLKHLIEWSGRLVRAEQSLRLRIRKGEHEFVPLPVLVSMKGGNLESEIAEAKKTSHFRGLQKLPIHFDGIQNTTLVDKYIVVVSL
jgi:16S rRNA (guanine527-N7)-methyltransferase